MPLPTEVFVMVVFWIGFPLFCGVIYSSGLYGKNYFTMAYVFLLLSNTFTVVEEFWFSDFFNLLEHCSIMGSSVCMLVAILQLTTGEKRILDEEKLNGRTGKEDA